MRCRPVITSEKKVCDTEWSRVKVSRKQQRFLGPSCLEGFNSLSKLDLHSSLCTGASSLKSEATEQKHAELAAWPTFV